MATKLELEKEAKILKQKIRDLESAEKKSGEDLQNLPNLSFGAHLSDGKIAVSLTKYNPEDNSSQFVETLFEEKSATAAIRKAQLELGKYMSELNKKR